MRPRTLPSGFIPPCLPTKAPRPPAGAVWLHEIKHDGFRVIARKDSARVRLYSRPGNDLTRQFPLIAEALARLRSRSCILDGEAVACDEKTGIACFDCLRHHRVGDRVFLYAFDLIEIGGDDLRREPLEVRKATLASVLARAGPGIRFNEHLDYDDGAAVFQHACKMGLEGIVSKRPGGRIDRHNRDVVQDGAGRRRLEGAGRYASRHCGGTSKGKSQPATLVGCLRTDHRGPELEQLADGRVEPGQYGIGPGHGCFTRHPAPSRACQ